MVVMLSTNDSTMKRPLGEISASFDQKEFDDTTIAGAIETIIAYSRETFGCPLAFITSTWYTDETYASLVDLLLKIQEKWNIGVIDMYHNEEMTALYGSELYLEYMVADGIHPHRKGYTEWWGPYIDQQIMEYLSGLETR